MLVFRTPTPTEEKELFEDIAKNGLTEANQEKIFCFYFLYAKKCVNNKLLSLNRYDEKEDFIGITYQVLVYAAKNFDLSENVGFKNYLSVAVLNELSKIFKHDKKFNQEISLETPIFFNTEEKGFLKDLIKAENDITDQKAEQNFFKNTLNKLINRAFLTYKEEQIGLKALLTDNQTEIKMSRERLRQLKKQVIKKLKKAL